MSSAAVSAAGMNHHIASSHTLPAAERAWKALEQHLGSGNLTSAQAAFNTYQMLSHIGSAEPARPAHLADRMAALGSALRSGDLGTSRSAFASVIASLL